MGTPRRKGLTGNHACKQGKSHEAMRAAYRDKLGVTFQSYDNWVASGAHLPAGVPGAH
jgi:hypothetical protein